MDIEEIKKEVTHIKISKNAIICGLAVALVLVSATAIALAFDHEEHHGGREHQGEKFRQEQNGYDDYSMNQNDTKPVSTTTPAVPAPTSAAPKPQQ